MVGIPRSSGCGLCVRRRIKCDEARPNCANCIRYGADCPGYTKELKFVIARTKRSPRRRDGRRSPTSSTKSQSPRSSTESIDLDINEIDDNNDLSKDEVIETSSPLLSLLLKTPGTYLDQAFSLFIERIKPTKGAMFMLVADWFSDLHSRPRGSLQTYALRCLTAHSLGKASQDDNLLHYGNTSYVHALGKLQSALHHPTAWNTSDTLCGAILLCYYELFAATTSSDSWMKHANGISKLIQSRGPSRHNNSFDTAILRAFRGVIIMDDFFNGRECFLSQPEWQSVMRVRYDDTMDEEVHQLLEDFVYYLSLTPPLLGRGYGLRGDLSNGIAIKVEDVIDLRTRTHDLYSSIGSWYERWSALVPEPKEIPSAKGDSRYPLILEYSDVSLGTIYCAYYACAIVMQEILTAVQPGLNYQAETNKLADKICMSVESVGSGLFGPYRMGFSLRIAYEVFDIERRVWIKEVLSMYQQLYGAIDPNTYPEVNHTT